MPSSRELNERHYRARVETDYRNHYRACLCSKDSRPGHIIACLDSIVIAVKGICRGNGQTDPRGGVGVFFHEDNNLNRALELYDAYTSQRADLHAAIQALKLALNIRRRNKKRQWAPEGPYTKLREVVVKTNSMYLVDAMAEHVDRWNANGYINAKGQDVVNEDLFRELDELADDLERMDVVVKFWHVSKSDNQEATELANEGLDCSTGSSSGDSYW